MYAKVSILAPTDTRGKRVRVLVWNDNETSTVGIVPWDYALNFEENLEAAVRRVGYFGPDAIIRPANGTSVGYLWRITV